MEYNMSDVKKDIFRKRVGKGTDLEKLWSLLDDIDTASDMFKLEQTPFYRYVMKKAEQRHKILYSDGYNLYFKDTQNDQQ